MAGDGETTVPQACALAVGCAAVVVAALTDAAFLGRHELGVRALVIGTVVGVAAVASRDWRHSAGVAVFGALVFVGFLAHRYGELTGDASAWPYTVLIAFPACLGRAVRGAYPPGAAGHLLVHVRQPRSGTTGSRLTARRSRAGRGSW